MAITIKYRPARIGRESALTSVSDSFIVDAVVEMIRDGGVTLEQMYRDVPVTRDEINEILSGLYDDELVYTDYRTEPAMIRWGWARTIYT